MSIPASIAPRVIPPAPQNKSIPTIRLVFSKILERNMQITRANVYAIHLTKSVDCTELRLHYAIVLLIEHSHRASRKYSNPSRLLNHFPSRTTTTTCEIATRLAITAMCMHWLIGTSTATVSTMPTRCKDHGPMSPASMTPFEWWRN